MYVGYIQQFEAKKDKVLNITCVWDMSMYMPAVRKHANLVLLASYIALATYILLKLMRDSC